MPYVKRKDGKIGIILAVDKKRKTYTVEFDYGCIEINFNNKNFKYAENLEELCDDLLFVDDDNKPHFLSKEGNVWYIGFVGHNKGGFGVIHYFDECGIFHIETITKMDKEGAMSLLCKIK